MFQKMINLYTGNNLSSMYVTAYVLAMARETGAGVMVWHGEDEEFPAAVDTLARMIDLMKRTGHDLPERSILIYNLDLSECDGLERIRESDPSVTIQMIEAAVPMEYMIRLKAASCFQNLDDVVAMCANHLNPMITCEGESI